MSYGIEVCLPKSELSRVSKNQFSKSFFFVVRFIHFSHLLEDVSILLSNVPVTFAEKLNLSCLFFQNVRFATRKIMGFRTA